MDACKNGILRDISNMSDEIESKRARLENAGTPPVENSVYRFLTKSLMGRYAVSKHLDYGKLKEILILNEIEKDPINFKVRRAQFEQLANEILEIFPTEDKDFFYVPASYTRGKFATVRRALHKTTGVQYAAKYIKKRRRNVNMVPEIYHEISVLLKCGSNNRVVRLYEVYETNSDMVLILGLAAGGELQRIFDGDQCLGEIEARRAMRQILEGLCFLHERNIAHLDLKPQNILLMVEDSCDDIKLCDFGISRLLEPGTEVRTLSGTPDYVAPEVVSYEPISLATDIWSVGVLAYVLLSGYTPFGADTKEQTSLNISKGIVTFEPEDFVDVSSVALDFIKSILVLNPKQRPTVQELLQHPWMTPQSHILPNLSLKTNNDAITVTPKSTPINQRKSLPCPPETTTPPPPTNNTRTTFNSDNLNGFETAEKEQSTREALDRNVNEKVKSDEVPSIITEEQNENLEEINSFVDESYKNESGESPIEISYSTEECQSNANEMNNSNDENVKHEDELSLDLLKDAICSNCFTNESCKNELQDSPREIPHCTKEFEPNANEINNSKETSQHISGLNPDLPKDAIFFNGFASESNYSPSEMQLNATEMNNSNETIQHIENVKQENVRTELNLDLPKDPMFSYSESELVSPTDMMSEASSEEIEENFYLLKPCDRLHLREEISQQNNYESDLTKENTEITNELYNRDEEIDFKLFLDNENASLRKSYDDLQSDSGIVGSIELEIDQSPLNDISDDVDEYSGQNESHLCENNVEHEEITEIIIDLVNELNLEDSLGKNDFENVPSTSQNDESTLQNNVNTSQNDESTSQNEEITSQNGEDHTDDRKFVNTFEIEKQIMLSFDFNSTLVVDDSGRESDLIPKEFITEASEMLCQDSTNYSKIIEPIEILSNTNVNIELDEVEYSEETKKIFVNTYEINNNDNHNSHQ